MLEIAAGGLQTKEQYPKDQEKTDWTGASAMYPLKAPQTRATSSHADRFRMSTSVGRVCGR